MCGIIGYVGSRASKPLARQGARTARVPRLRLRGHRPARGRRSRVRPGGRQPPVPEGGRRSERLPVHDRPRPHALGDARRRHRAERAPADRLRRRQARDRPQRDRRELPRAPRGAAGGGAHLLAPRPTPRWSRTSSRTPTTATSSEPMRAAYVRLEGHFTIVAHPPRPPEPPRRRAQPDADGGRARRRRELPRVESRGVPDRDAPRAVPRRRRDRVDQAERGLDP